MCVFLSNERKVCVFEQRKRGVCVFEQRERKVCVWATRERGVSLHLEKDVCKVHCSHESRVFVCVSCASS